MGAASFPQRIHLTGASGSGTTTLGRRLAAQCGYPHFDTDDYFWQPSDPPYQSPWPMPGRLEGLQAALAPHHRWVLSGSLAGWGDRLIQHFDVVIFLAVPAKVRLARLADRQRQRHGAAIDAGGPLHETHRAFLDWAAAYDDGDETMRSRQRHETWLKDLSSCPVIRLEGTESVEERMATLLQRWA